MAEAYSVGSPTTDAEVERLADALGMAFRVTRERSLAPSPVGEGRVITQREDLGLSACVSL